MYVYIITNKNNTTLYVGVTNNLLRRIWEHKNQVIDGFSKKYNLHKLVYFTMFEDESSAIACEKYLKKCYRKTKQKLISQFNPQWSDLYENLIQEQTESEDALTHSANRLSEA